MEEPDAPQGWWERHLFGPDPPHVFVTDDPNATDAIVAHTLARPDSIRHRAQSAAGISTAVAAALAVAAIGQVLGQNDEDWETPTIAALVVAFALWLATVWLYVRVVTLGQREEDEEQEKRLERERTRPRGGASLPPRELQALITLYEDYSNRLRKSLKVAALSSALALVATAAGATLVVSERLHDDPEQRDMVLDQRATAAVARLCGWPTPATGQPRRIRVDVPANDLSKQVVELTVFDCDGEKVRVPRGVILATRDR